MLTTLYIFNHSQFDVNTNNHEYDDSTSSLFNTELELWALFFLVIPAFTIFGNILVVLSVLKYKSLQCAINYFILALAIADCLVAVAVMPFAVYVHVNIYLFLFFDWNSGQLWEMGNQHVVVWSVHGDRCDLFDGQHTYTDRDQFW